MEPTSQTHALPWAKVESAETPEVHTQQQSAQTVFDPHLLPGQRIEIRWQLTGESGEAETKWWGAALLKLSEPEDSSVWDIRYDACKGFEPEEAEVQFISPGHLQHMDDSSILRWRQEGTNGGASDEEEEEEEEAAEDVINLRELTAEQEALERQMGQTMEEAAMQHMRAQMAPDQQQHVLAGFRTFANHFKSQLQELIQQNEGKEYVITASDVNQIMQGLHQH